MHDRSLRSLHGLACVILFLSGAAALAHQILWTRRLVDLLGASPQTFSRVVSVFFLGLCCGCAAAALRPAPIQTAWRRIAGAELFVAVAALGPLLAVNSEVRLVFPERWISRAGGVLIPFLAITPAAFAMGLVFPAVLSLLGRTVGSRRLLLLYSLNTAGGVLGIGFVYFLALPRIGILFTGLAACALNVVVAAVAMGLRPRPSLPHRSMEPERANPRSAHVKWRLIGLAMASGFGVLGLEVLLQHQYAQVTINSYLSSAVVLGSVLVGLAGASLLAAREWWRDRGLMLAAWACLLEPLVFHLVQPGLSFVPYDLAPARYFARVALLAGLTAIPVFLMSGLVFPLVLVSVEGVRRIAILLAANGIGGWLGAELMQGGVLPWGGLWLPACFLGFGYAVLAWLFPSASGDGRRSRVPFVGFAAAFLMAVGFSRNLPQVRPSEGDRVVEVDVGREGVVATVTGAADDWRMIFNNTYTLGGSRAGVSQERQALLPILIQGSARRVALLGVATGSTTAGAILDPFVESVEAFELSPLTAGMALRHFADWNRNALRDARVKLVIEDARIGMLRESNAFDVVVGDLFLPWRTGEGRLYAREHFAAVRRALREGGLFCQWLPLYQLTRREFDTIARTFRKEFPAAFLVRGDFYADLPIVGLCGFSDSRDFGRLDWAAIEAACERVRVGPREVSDPLVRWPEGVAMCLLGPLGDPGAGPVNTLNNAWIEWDAGRNLIGMREPWFVGVPWAELARDTHRVGAALLPSRFRSAHDAGQFYLTLEIAAVSGSPVRGNLEAQIPERMPERMWGDPGASWESWPARTKPIHGGSQTGF